MSQPPNLSAKQSRFATAYAQHHNASRACREAGYSAGCASVTGTRLLSNDSVCRRIQALEAVNAADLGVTRQHFLSQLQTAAELARIQRNPQAMIAAWREIGKACGLYQSERVAVDLNVAGPVDLGNLRNVPTAELLAIIASGRAT